MLRTAVAVFIIFALCCFGVFAFYYIRYERIITKKMSGQIFSTSAKIYARPVTVHPGDQILACADCGHAAARRLHRRQ